jgi:hypothetical protein
MQLKACFNECVWSLDRLGKHGFRHQVVRELLYRRKTRCSLWCVASIAAHVVANELFTNLVRNNNCVSQFYHTACSLYVVITSGRSAGTAGHLC